MTQTQNSHAGRDTLRSLEHHAAFIERHIGPDDT